MLSADSHACKIRTTMLKLPQMHPTTEDHDRDERFSPQETERHGEPSSPVVDEHAVLHAVMESLKTVDQQTRTRIVKTVATFYGLDVRDDGSPRPQPAAQSIRDDSKWRTATREPVFSGRRELSPKLFLMEKDPRTDIERVACLAFYLTHFRDMPHFRTVDISKLNTEAAQLKFSNAAYAFNNAAKKGLIAPASKGMKQISAIGEAFVSALPDRDAAKDVLTNVRRRRSRTQKRADQKGSPQRR